MNLLNSYSQSFLAVNQARSDAQKEQFKITSVSLVNGKLNITAQNTGQIPINITRLWVQNTTTTNWVAKYQTGFTVPSGVSISNVGTAIPLSVNPANSYYVKLVTSRGNSQAFTFNSVGTAPLNIQFYAFPSAIPSGFESELVMIVTNNQSSTLTNLVPQISKWTSNPLPSTASCTVSAMASPPSVNALPPGSTAIFKWNLKMTGHDDQFCTYIASLQNGFPSNTASATVTLNPITATSSNWSTTWGILSINYTTLQWTQNGAAPITWNNAWSVPAGPSTVWRVNITDNDPTRPFVLNGNTTLDAFGAIPGSNAVQQFYIIKNDFPNPGINGYPTNSQIIAANSTTSIYFGASGAGNNSPVNFKSSQPGQYAIAILSFGYWSSVASGNFFGQNIPYEGIIVK